MFNKAIFIDRHNQNITTLERKEKGCWLIRSMNPATTGQHRPPYAQETPLGMFVLQEKKTKMIFLKDGSAATGGFAPYASRFNNGGYIHGVPTNAPATGIIEYSYTLGTIPRSHMCVRNATSHAKFISNGHLLMRRLYLFWNRNVRNFAPVIQFFHTHAKTFYSCSYSSFRRAMYRPGRLHPKRKLLHLSLHLKNGRRTII